MGGIAVQLFQGGGAPFRRAVVPVVGLIAAPLGSPDMGVAGGLAAGGGDLLAVCLIAADRAGFVAAAGDRGGGLLVDNPAPGGVGGIAVLLAVIRGGAVRHNAVVPVVGTAGCPSGIPVVGVAGRGIFGSDCQYGSRTEGLAVYSVHRGHGDLNGIGSIFFGSKIKGICTYIYQFIAKF